MENQKLQIISDSGEESAFQMASLYNEQFMEVFKTIEFNKEQCIDLIDKSILSLKEEMLKSSFIVVDMFYNMDKEFNEKIESEKKTLVTVFQDRLVNLEDSIEIAISNANIFTTEKIDDLRNTFLYSLAMLNEEINKKSVEIIKLQEEKNIILELTDKNVLDVIIQLQGQVKELQNEIINLKISKVDIKKPWYKRLFSK